MMSKKQGQCQLTISFFFVQKWETVEKTLPDGTKKRVRRKILMVKVVKKPKDVNENDDKKSPVEEKPFQHQEVDIDEANPEDEKYDPKVIKKLLNLILRKNVLERKKLFKYFLLYYQNSQACRNCLNVILI